MRVRPRALGSGQSGAHVDAQKLQEPAAGPQGRLGCPVCVIRLAKRQGRGKGSGGGCPGGKPAACVLSQPLKPL